MRWLSAAAAPVAALRLGVYTEGHIWPTGIGGRFATGRWLIPVYDQVFVGPLCTLVTGLLAAGGTFLLARAGYATAAGGGGLAAALVVTVAINAGPSLRRWNLTGGHRILPQTSQRTAANQRAAKNGRNGMM